MLQLAMHNEAWAAGLFEGEGSISPRSGSEWLWQLQLSSTDEDVVRKFFEIVGAGKVYGPYGYANGSSQRREHHKPYWRWCVSDAHGIEQAAMKLSPYLLGRRATRLQECLEAVSKTPTRRGPRPRDN